MSGFHGAPRFFRVLNKRFIFFFILILVVLSCTKESPSSVDESESWMEELFAYLCSPSINGRYSGSEGIMDSCAYICDVINSGDDSLNVVQFSHGDIPILQNIVFHVNGKCDSTLVFGAHYDAYGYKTRTNLPGADDNVSGVAVLLSLIKRLQQTGFVPHYCIEICFWDGEEIGRLGSNYYVSSSINQKSLPYLAYFNIDTVGNGEFYNVSLSYDQTHEDVKDMFVSVAEKLSLSVTPYNPIGFTTDCEPFLKKHIPFVNLCCDKLPPYLHKSSDDISKISFAQLNQISGTLYDFIVKL